MNPRELVERLLERIELEDRHLRSYVTISKKALDEATQLTSELTRGKYRGPLHGIPVSAKDLIDTKHIRTTYGSSIFADYVPDSDACVIRHLKQKGAIIIGKTNTHEFGLGIVTPPTRNPWDQDRMPGGSSGGSAAALASGLAVAALGTDTGGSIRIPASMCGVSGLKPTFGKLSMEGIFPAAWTMDHVGPMCRFASDVPMLVRGMGYPLKSATTRLPVRLGIIREFSKVVGRGVKHAFESCVDKMVSEGIAEVKEVRVPAIDEAFISAERIDAAEVATIHRRLYAKYHREYRNDSARLVEAGLKVNAVDYIIAQQAREVFLEELTHLFNQLDALICPAAPSVAPTLKEVEKFSAHDYDPYFKSVEIFNLLGLPALVVPCGFIGGLPIGVQFVGPADSDEIVVQLGIEFQKVTDWHLRTPEDFGDRDL